MGKIKYSQVFDLQNMQKTRIFLTLKVEFIKVYDVHMTKLITNCL